MEVISVDACGLIKRNPSIQRLNLCSFNSIAREGRCRESLQWYLVSGPFDRGHCAFCSPREAHDPHFRMLKHEFSEVVIRVRHDRLPRVLRCNRCHGVGYVW